MLEALQAVDAVIVFETETPADLIAAVQPDVLVKGGDYDPEASKGESGFIVGSEEVRVVIAPLVAAGHGADAHEVAEPEVALATRGERVDVIEPGRVLVLHHQPRRRQ